MRYSENFTDYDFPEGIPHPSFIAKLQKARNIFGRPIIITSGGRTSGHNLAIGGVSNSSHLIREDGYFCGADLRCRSDLDRFHLVNALLEAGFVRIGIYDRHIHVDTDGTKTQNVMWWGKS